MCKPGIGGEGPPARQPTIGRWPKDVVCALKRGGHDWAAAMGLASGGLVSLRYGTEAESVAGTRRLMEEALRRWSIHSSRDDVVLVATELVTNAIRHALRDPAERGWLAIGLRGTGVICAVTDPSADPPVISPPHLVAESGYGLHIVEQMSEAWGHFVMADSGKVVWAQIPVAAAQPATW